MRPSINYCFAQPAPHSLDPHNHLSLAGLNIQRHWGDPLIEYDDSMKLVGALAERWERLDDTTWKFHLKKGIKFHNGEEFTSQSVRVTLERLSDPKHEVFQGIMWMPVEVDATNPHVAVIRTSEPFGPLLTNLTLTEMLPPGALRENPKALWEHPVGTGPFRFVSRIDNRIVVEAADNGWRGKPKIGEIVFDYKRTPEERADALRRGEDHITERLPYDQLDLLHDDPRFTVLEIPSAEIRYLKFRCDEEPLNRPEVRQAVMYAIDRRSIVNNVLKGRGRVADAHVPSSVFGYEPQPQYQYNPKKAKELVSKAGYPNGTPVMRQVATAGFHPQFEEVTLAIRDYCADVGINVEVNFFDYKKRLELLVSDRQYIWDDSGFGCVTYDSHMILFPNYFSQSAYRYRFNTYRNDDVDIGLLQGAKSIDPARRQAGYSRALRTLWRELPSLPTYEATLAIGLAKNLQGFRVQPNLHALVGVGTELL